MSDLFLDPGRIGWISSVSATVFLLMVGEVTRIVAWNRHDTKYLPRVVALALPGNQRRSPVAVTAGIDALRAGLRIACVAPLAFSTLVILRPPADITTVIVGVSLAWWAAFTVLALTNGQRLLRTTHVQV